MSMYEKMLAKGITYHETRKRLLALTPTQKKSMDFEYKKAADDFKTAVNNVVKSVVAPIIEKAENAIRNKVIADIKKSRLTVKSDNDVAADKKAKAKKDNAPEKIF